MTNDTKYILTLYATDYVHTNGEYKTVRTKTHFTCQSLVCLLDLFTDMVKTSQEPLEFEVKKEESNG